MNRERMNADVRERSRSLCTLGIRLRLFRARDPQGRNLFGSRPYLFLGLDLVITFLEGTPDLRRR